MKHILAVASLTVAPAVSSVGWAFAHGGGLNKDGCHNNRKTGGYHCHRRVVWSEIEPKRSSAAVGVN